MKKIVIRIVSLALALVLSLSMLPQKAEAGILDMVKKNSSGTVSGYWTGEKFWRNNRYTEPFAFYSALNNCTGFTMDFELVEVYEGNLLSGDFKSQRVPIDGSYELTYVISGNTALDVVLPNIELNRQYLLETLLPK